MFQFACKVNRFMSICKYYADLFVNSVPDCIEVGAGQAVNVRLKGG